MAEDEPASLHDKGNTNAMTCVTKLRNNLTDGNLLDNNVSDIHLRLSILENILASKQKTLAVLTEKFAWYAMIIQKTSVRSGEVKSPPSKWSGSGVTSSAGKSATVADVPRCFLMDSSNLRREAVWTEH